MRGRSGQALVAGAALVFLASSRWAFRRRIVAALLIAATAGLVGAQFHYFANPAMRIYLGRSLTMNSLSAGRSATSAARSSVASLRDVESCP